MFYQMKRSAFVASLFQAVLDNLSSLVFIVTQNV